jgi:hypothetical protein
MAKVEIKDPKICEHFDPSSGNCGLIVPIQKPLIWGRSNERFSRPSKSQKKPRSDQLNLLKLFSIVNEKQCKFAVTKDGQPKIEQESADQQQKCDFYAQGTISVFRIQDNPPETDKKSE